VRGQRRRSQRRELAISEGDADELTFDEHCAALLLGRAIRIDFVRLKIRTGQKVLKSSVPIWLLKLEVHEALRLPEEHSGNVDFADFEEFVEDLRVRVWGGIDTCS
jgi:hypothetical protein